MSTVAVMPEGTRVEDTLTASTHDFYRRMVLAARRSGIEFLIGGTYAIEHWAGIARPSKDLDLFVRPRDCEPLLEVLKAEGCRVELTYPHWLGKAISGEAFIDVIFSAGNGIAKVDDIWFENAGRRTAFGVPNLPLCPAEETLWSKAWVMERERFDGADVAHILRARAEKLDWERLLMRFGDDWRVLLSHLVMFGFVYPCERHRVPDWVMKQLTDKLAAESGSEPAPDRVCRGTLVSREQYLIDIDRWEYDDARLGERKTMTPEDVAHWTAAIQLHR
jgi:hypothetical protein